MTARSTTTTRTLDRILRIRLMNQHQLSDPKVLDRVWGHLDSPLVEPTKFDSVERARREFRADAVTEAAELFDRDLHLFVRGAKDDFLAVFTRRRPNLSIGILGRRRGQSRATGTSSGSRGSSRYVPSGPSSMASPAPTTTTRRSTPPCGRPREALGRGRAPRSRTIFKHLGGLGRVDELRAGARKRMRRDDTEPPFRRAGSPEPKDKTR